MKNRDVIAKKKKRKKNCLDLYCFSDKFIKLKTDSKSFVVSGDVFSLSFHTVLNLFESE